MFPIDRTNFDRAMADCGIMDLGAATIRQIVGLANRLAEVADDDCVHLDVRNLGCKCRTDLRIRRRINRTCRII